MKRFAGGLLALVGAVAVVWSAYYVLSGHSGARIYLTPTVSFTSLTSGLAGLAVLTLGILWARD
jgi:hypothetical protein